jgi:hypothetical protein
MWGKLTHHERLFCAKLSLGLSVTDMTYVGKHGHSLTMRARWDLCSKIQKKLSCTSVFTFGVLAGANSDNQTDSFSNGVGHRLSEKQIAIVNQLYKGVRGELNWYSLMLTDKQWEAEISKIKNLLNCVTLFELGYTVSRLGYKPTQNL